MDNIGGFFEIPVADMARAIRFYESVLDCQLTLATIDGNEMANFPLDESAPGITGALTRGGSYTPSKQGTRIYLNVKSIDHTLAKVITAGGKVLYPKTSIGELGHVAEFEDSEGNCIALHQR